MVVDIARHRGSGTHRLVDVQPKTALEVLGLQAPPLQNNVNLQYVLYCWRSILIECKYE